jgi:hypothetical protein
MDKYGFCGYVRNLVNRASDDLRGTGRTTSMLDRMKDNDVGVFASHVEARRFVALAKSCGKDVLVTVVDPKEPVEFSRPLSRDTQFVLDHNWIEEYLQNTIQYVSERIGDIEASPASKAKR